MKEQGTDKGKNDTSSEMISIKWGNFNFYGYLGCWKMH